MNQQIIMHKRPPETCEVEATIAIIASKWKPMILFNLWRSLRELEEDNLISFSKILMTVRGKSLLPVLDVMSKWAATEHGIA